MIGWFKRLLRPGSYREEDTDAVIHGVRNQTQVAQLQTHLIQRRREREDLADALAHTRPPFRIREEHRP